MILFLSQASPSREERNIVPLEPGELIFALAGVNWSTFRSVH